MTDYVFANSGANWWWLMWCRGDHGLLATITTKKTARLIIWLEWAEPWVSTYAVPKSERSQHFTSASGKQTFLSVFRLTAKKQLNSNLHKFRLCSRLPLVRKGWVKYRVVTRGQGGTTPGRRSITGGAESPNYTTSTFFNTVRLLPKDLFRTWGPKVDSYPGRHLTSLSPWLGSRVINYSTVL